MKRYALLLILLVPLAVCGCATGSKALKSQIKELEREVARLKAERANLKARHTAADDQVMVLEKKLARCTEPKLRERRVQVVRLSPEDLAPEEPPASWPERRPRRHSDEKRLQLVLHGASSSTAAQRTQRVRPVASETVHATLSSEGLSPDNLGVVPIGNEPPADLGGPDPMQQFNDAYRAYSNKRYDDALALFASFARDHVSHEYADNAMFWRGECYMAKGRYFKAIGEFERMLKRFPRSDKAASGLYKVGYAYDQLRDSTKALEYYFRVVERHPGTDAARRASRRVATIKGRGGQSPNLTPTAATR